MNIFVAVLCLEVSEMWTAIAFCLCAICSTAYGHRCNQVGVRSGEQWTELTWHYNAPCPVLNFDVNTTVSGGFNLTGRYWQTNSRLEGNISCRWKEFETDKANLTFITGECNAPAENICQSTHPSESTTTSTWTSIPSTSGTVPTTAVASTTTSEAEQTSTLTEATSNFVTRENKGTQCVGWKFDIVSFVIGIVAGVLVSLTIAMKYCLLSKRMKELNKRLDYKKVEPREEAMSQSDNTRIDVNLVTEEEFSNSRPERAPHYENLGPSGQKLTQDKPVSSRAIENGACPVGNDKSTIHGHDYINVAPTGNNGENVFTPIRIASASNEDNERMQSLDNDQASRDIANPAYENVPHRSGKTRSFSRYATNVVSAVRAFNPPKILQPRLGKTTHPRVALTPVDHQRVKSNVGQPSPSTQPSDGPKKKALKPNLANLPDKKNTTDSSIDSLEVILGAKKALTPVKRK